MLAGDPSDALTRLAGSIPSATARPPLEPAAAADPADVTGPHFTSEAILEALDAATDESTVVANG